MVKVHKNNLSVEKISLAIENWLSESKKPRLALGKWKTIKGGIKTRLLSEQADSK